MTRLFATLAAGLLAAAPALAQQAAPQPGGAVTPSGPPKDVPMARLMSDGAQVRGGVGDKIVLQLGKFVFLCRQDDGKPATCDLVP